MVGRSDRVTLRYLRFALHRCANDRSYVCNKHRLALRQVRLHDDFGKRSRATMLVRSRRQSHSTGDSVKFFAAKSFSYG